MIDYFLLAMMAGFFIAAAAAGVVLFCMIYIGRRKVNKEIGMWKRHRQFRPARPEKVYWFRSLDETR